ncbi:MAG: alpha/beta hydrolase [Saprospiraceae bacterium]|nr:alpha/beta hydrolase [Saprospiraceae bacterium]
MKVFRNLSLKGAAKRTFLLDVYYAVPKPHATVLFVHGFKGFKDWGIWDLIARQFAEAGYLFIKFNLSHNGTTPQQPLEFPDLEAFGQNNYSKEITDIDAVLTWLSSQPQALQYLEQLPSQINYIGHSRGGGLGIVKAAMDKRIDALITWAAVSRLDYAWLEEGFIERWKEKGVYHALNGRTGQKMPLYYQMYEDFAKAGDEYITQKAAKNIDQPVLIVHGTDDPAVSEQAAYELKDWLGEQAQLKLIAGANHVFGGSHPYNGTSLPGHAQVLVDTTLQFLESLRH